MTIYEPTEFEKKCRLTSVHCYDWSYPPGDARRYGGRKPALWRRLVRRITDWVTGER